MNTSTSTQQSDVVASWRDLHHDARLGGLAGMVRWVAATGSLPSSGVADLLDLPTGFVAEVLASTAALAGVDAHPQTIAAKQRRWNGSGRPVQT